MSTKSKTLQEIEQEKTASLPADEYEFFLDKINLLETQDKSVSISQTKNELSTCNTTLSSNGTLIYYKIDSGAQYDIMYNA